MRKRLFILTLLAGPVFATSAYDLRTTNSSILISDNWDGERYDAVREYLRSNIFGKIANKENRKVFEKMFSRCPSGYHFVVAENSNYKNEDVYGTIIYREGCERTDICEFHVNLAQEVAEVRTLSTKAVYEQVDAWVDDNADQLAQKL